jgi:tetratricopeptide repeat protein
MSLLLQALQKAAKNREVGAPAPDAVSSEPSAEPEHAESTLPAELSVEAHVEEKPSEPGLALEEEDLFEHDELAATTATERFEPFATPSASSAKAATVLRASEMPTSGWVDWIRDHPVHTFAALAFVFMLFYGGYVYLQLFHPALLRGDFLSKPLAANTPPPLAQPNAPPPAAPPAAAPTAAAPSGQTPDAAAAPVAQSPAPSGAKPPAAGPTGPAPPASIVGMPQGAHAKNARTGWTESQARRPEAAPRSFRKSMDDSVALAPPLEDHLTGKPAGAGPASLPPGIAEAYQALQAGKLDLAESRYRAVLQADAHNVDALLGLATIAVQRGNAQQAIGFYEQALQVEPRNAVAQAGMIDIIGQADPQLSETHLKQLIAREPSAFLFFSLGNLYARQAVWPAAQAAYFQAYNLQPDNPDYAYNLAIGLEHLEQPKLALTYYRKALELSFQKGHANFDQNRVIERIGQLAARVD